MSVGHIARLLEEAGISTVIVGIQAFRPRLEVMTPSRVLLTPHLMGRNLGAPGDRDRQRATVEAALDLLAGAEKAGTFIESPGPYRCGDVGAGSVGS